ncbi:thermonuclease family protein [Macrococcus lamae]|uniref:Uncharacterized protein n=1 Tax=Macrococcus lamae TaxID=198484 RepID=A0A4R6BWI2_9STAP|nr:SdrD B-like domain-containing protein [Macrococcus lamae]TDM12824.1 hypothetical protein ERX29_02135 [Macrococcus lamae]
MNRLIKVFLTLMITASLAIPFSSTKAQAAGKLLISEYVEGSGYNKAIEIYNPTSEAVDLSTYSLVSFINGASETSGTVTELKLSGPLPAGEVFVIANQQAGAEVLAQADLKTGSSVMNFNGDDTLVLFENYNAASKTGDINDSIGQAGVDPGTAFGSDVSTVDMTLVRTADKLTADTDIHNSYNPADQFIALPKDTFNELGAFNGGVVAPEPETPKAEYKVNVVRVVDGDTIKISPSIMGSDTIRFLNIDTPETYHLTSYDESLIDTDPDHNQKYHGEIAKKALNDILTAGMPVTVKVNPEEITDDYGRVLGQVVREDGVNANLEMVKRGMASTYFIWPVANWDDYNMFQNAVAEAQKENIGIWQEAHPLMELAFEFRARYDGKGFLRYVGNSESKVYYDPQNFAQVPVENRIFFTQEEAIAQGYKPAPGNGGTLPEETAKEMTIKEARDSGKGTKAIVTGTVTKVDGYNIYIQDDTAGMVIRSKTVKPAVGDGVEAIGETAEYFGLYQMETEDVKVTGQKAVEPVVTILDAINEDVESEFIRIENVTVKSVNEFNEYTVVDAKGHQFAIKTADALEIGASYYQIDGVVTYSYGAYKLLPVNIVKDAPVKPAFDIAGFAFHDKNHNGKLDQPDRKLADVRVNLYQDDKLVKTVMTNAQGEYVFNAVENGKYIVEFTSPNGLVETLKDMTVDDKDSDIEDNKVAALVADAAVKDVSAGFTKNIGKLKKK